MKPYPWVNKKYHNTPYSQELRGKGFKMVDVVVFTRMFGVKDEVAVKTLIESTDGSFNGTNIDIWRSEEGQIRREKRGIPRWSHDNWQIPSRAEAAQVIFEAKFGEPTTGIESMRERDERNKKFKEEDAQIRESWHLGRRIEFDR